MNIEDLYDIFKDDGIIPGWLYALKVGETKMYGNTHILNWHIDDNVCCINSASVNNSKFPKTMLRDIRALIREYENVIISSSVTNIQRYMSKYGFAYDTQNQIYIKGKIWEAQDQ